MGISELEMRSLLLRLVQVEYQRVRSFDRPCFIFTTSAAKTFDERQFDSNFYGPIRYLGI